MYKILCFFLIFICSAVAEETDISGIYKKELVSIDVEVIDSTFFRSVISTDNKYLAIFNLVDEKNGLAKLEVYELKSGLLIAERLLNSDSFSPYVNIQFLQSNKVVFLDGFHGEEQYLWYFEEKGEIIRSCWGGMLGYVEDSSNDGATILYRTYDGKNVLCGSSRVKSEVIYTGVGEGESSVCSSCGGDSLIILEGNKILVMYNFGSKGSEVDYRQIERPSDDINRPFWDVDYFSDLPNLKAFWDKKRDVVHFIEFSEMKIKTKLIKYKAKKIEEGLNMDLNLSPSDFVAGDDYILIKSSDDQLALLEKNADGLDLKWVKKIDSGFLDKISFRKDGVYFTSQKIVFVDFISSSRLQDPDTSYSSPFAVVMDVKTGELESYTSRPYQVNIEPLNTLGWLLKAGFQEKYEKNYAFSTAKNEFFGLMGIVEAISDDRSVILVRSQAGLDIWRTSK